MSALERRDRKRTETTDVRVKWGSRNRNRGRQFCTRYELGQVASAVERVLVWYVHLGMHELQDEQHSFLPSDVLEIDDSRMPAKRELQ